MTFRALWRRFKRRRGAVAALLVLVVWFTLALFAPWIAPHHPTRDLSVPLQDVGSPDHPLGTDNYGRDVLSRLLHGGRISLTIGFVVVGISLLLGVTLGALAGYYGGVIDTVIMRVVDILFAFPFFILAIAIMAVLGPGIINAMIALGLVTWIHYARLVRAQVLVARETEYVEAARAIGVGDGLIIFRHIIPNTMGPIIVQSTLGVGSAILAAAGLSFLGLGAQPPDPEWGAMLNEGRAYMRVVPHLTIIPGTAISIVVLCLNVVGDGLRDVFDPKLIN